MSIYLDASAFYSLHVNDKHTPRITMLARQGTALIISRWTLAEFTSGVALGVRRGVLPATEATVAEARADRWVNQRPFNIVAVLDGDHASARDAMRKIRAPLRAGDALHLAIASRNGLELATFDADQARAARELAVPLAAL